MKVPIGWLTFMFELIFSHSHIFHSQPMNLVVKVTAMKKMMTAMMMMVMMVMMMMRFLSLYGALMSDSDQNENITLN